MVEREGPLSLRRQCQLLGLNRGAVYYEPVEIGAYELELMALIAETMERDRQLE